MYLKGTFSGSVGLYMILTLLVFSEGFAVTFHRAFGHSAHATYDSKLSSKCNRNSVVGTVSDFFNLRIRVPGLSLDKIKHAHR